MDRFKRLNNQFFSLNLYSGKTNFRYGHNILCFFIVEHPCSEEFIKEQALQLLMTPCRNFDFYGAYSQEWENGFDDVDIMLHPDEEDMDIALTSCWNDFEEFVDALHLAAFSRHFVPCDIHLIYDDEQLYNRVIARLKEYGEDVGDG